MKEKILEFLKEYIDYKITDEKDKLGVICLGLNLLLKEEKFNKDSLRKSLSVYIKRIISEKEFDNLLDPNNIEYQLLILERENI